MDLEFLNTHRELLNPPQEFLIARLYRKRGFNLRGFHDDYFCNASSLVLSDHNSACDMVYCGRKTQFNKSGYCTRRFWCPRCANRQGYHLQQELLQQCEAVPLYFLTISYDRPVMWGLNVLDHMQQLAWILENAVRLHVKKGPWKGASTIVEIAVADFLPLSVIPHIHALVQADSVDQEDLLKLEELIFMASPDLLSGLNCAPRIHIRKIASQADLYRVLNYLRKPILIGRHYRNAWDQKVLTGDFEASELNEELSQLVYGVDLAFQQNLIVKRFGALNSNHPQYWGLSRVQRIDRADELKALVDELRGQTVD